jgi:hypothetical protein
MSRVKQKTKAETVKPPPGDEMWLGKFKKERYKLDKRDNNIYLEEGLKDRHYKNLASNKGEFTLIMPKKLLKKFDPKDIPISNLTLVEHTAMND